MKRAFMIFVLLLIAPSSVLAWGANGHRVVGRIAANHLTAEAAVAVASLIGPEGLDQVSTWADDIRNDPNWQPPLKNPSPWHYISIDDGETLETTARDPNGDVLEAIARFSAVLRDGQVGLEDGLRRSLRQPRFVGRMDPSELARPRGFPHQPPNQSRGSAARTRASGSPSSRRTMLVPSTSATHL